MSTYNKTYLTFEQQLALLKSRGLEVTSDIKALEYLRRIGCYRLSAYWYPLRKITTTTDINTKITTYKRADEFIPNAKFRHVVELYVFDKKLRLLLLDALERIEVAIRVDISSLLGSIDHFGHMNSNLLHGNFVKKINPRTQLTNYQSWLKKHDELMNRSKEDFVNHYKSKYGLPLPIWVSAELWDFGLLSTFYQGMSFKDKNFIAAKYHISKCEVMESWLRCLNYNRNIVAHHGRLWNKNFVDQPKLPKPGEIPAFDSLRGRIECTSRVYSALCILSHMMRSVYPNSKWPTRIRELVDTFPHESPLSISDMGFPTNWEKQNFWI